MRYYKIDENTLRTLIEAELQLNCLECAGVDNWHYYGEAFSEAIRDFKEEYNIPIENDVQMGDLYEKEMERYSEYLID